MEQWLSALGPELLEALASLGDLVSSKDSSLVAFFTSIRKQILEHFGTNGLYAAYISFGAISLFALAKILKLTYSILRLVVLPAVALAFIGSFFLPMNFFYLLPVTVSLSSVWLLVRG